MKKVLLSMSMVLILLMSALQSKSQVFADRLTFSAQLSAAPGVTTSGNGAAAFMLNSPRDTMYFTITVSSLTSALNGFHIHNARTGGNVVVDFSGKVSGTTVRSFITGSTLVSLLPDFIMGNLYVAVHTTTNPLVEILGIIRPETDLGFAAMLDGTQAGTVSTAKGHGSVNFSMKGDTAIVRVATNGLSGKITSIHLHTGKPGQSGGVIVHFETLIATDSLSVVGGVSISSATWPVLMTALMMDSVYLNIHTLNFPAGEIRGQLRSSPDLRFDAWMNQANHVMAGASVGKVSTAYGVMTLSLNPMMDTLRFSGVFSGLTSNMTGAHFHNGPVTGSGAVVKNLVPTISNNVISGMWTKYDSSNPLTSAMINELLKGNIYMNIHTDSNPGGEIRGNVMRLAREGFVGEINGTQAGTASTAMGTVVASYDRDMTNLHYMISYNGLGSAFSGAHFHAGQAGMSGGVIFGLGTPVNNSFTGFWTAAQGFNSAKAVAFQHDSVYVNIHDSLFANGEIRGQLWRYYRISSPTASVGVNEHAPISKNSISYFPNPVHDRLSVKFNSTVSGKGEITLFDLNGRKITSQAFSLSAGDNEILVPAVELHNGIYMAEVVLNGEMASHMMIVKQ